MSNAKLGREPAFPVWTDDMPVVGSSGISKRFFAACAAMKGILSSGKFILPNEKDFAYCSELSYRFADELLKQENQ